MEFINQTSRRYSPTVLYSSCLMAYPSPKCKLTQNCSTFCTLCNSYPENIFELTLRVAWNSVGFFVFVFLELWMSVLYIYYLIEILAVFKFSVLFSWTFFILLVGTWVVSWAIQWWNNWPLRTWESCVSLSCIPYSRNLEKRLGMYNLKYQRNYMFCCGIPVQVLFFQQG